MFESVQRDDIAARLRSAAMPPFAASGLALLYFTIYPMLARVPAALFWAVVLVLLAGTVVGAVAILRAVRSERPRGRAIGWLVAAVIVELLCARTLLSLTFPWL